MTRKYFLLFNGFLEVPLSVKIHKLLSFLTDFCSIFHSFHFQRRNVLSFLKTSGIEALFQEIFQSSNFHWNYYVSRRNVFQTFYEIEISIFSIRNELYQTILIEILFNKTCIPYVGIDMRP